MPGNQPTSNLLSAPLAPPKGSNLVRSKSLRLSSSARPKPETTTNSLTRHGSIRIPRPQVPVLNPTAKLPSKKPALKPKPSFCSSRGVDGLDKAMARSMIDLDGKKALTSSYIKGSNNGFECHVAQADSPTSLHSERSHSQNTTSWCGTDLVGHLKRLTEEHDKLQVEHARLRMQLLDNLSCAPVSNLKREHQHLSQSDSHLSSIPENTSDGMLLCEGTSQTQSQDALLQQYRKEILQLQEDNRKLQRKYWDQVMNSELVEDDSSNVASQQIVNLIDNLDEKEKEIVEATGKVQELDNHLAATNLELQQCHDALQDQQRALDETTTQRDEMSRHLREYRRALAEAKETIDFMQNEQANQVESMQEMEQALQQTKAEFLMEHNKSNELRDKARKLFAKVHDKNLLIQLLKTELDRTQGSCRDMLLSQGAELTMLSMNLSQMSMTVHSMLTAAADFAAAELSLQKEMLEEVMADLDSDGDKSDSSSKENDLSKNNLLIPNSPNTSQMNSLSADTHESLPDIFGSEPPSPMHCSASSESDRPVSLVQSMVRAIEQTSKSDPQSLKPLPLKPYEQNSDSVKSSIENLNSVNGDLSHLSSPGKIQSVSSSPVASGLFKPVGMATAFRPARQQSLESDIPLLENIPFEEVKKTSLESQLSQLECLIKKVGKVIELTREKFSEKLKLVNEEKNKVQDEVWSSKNKQYQLQADLHNTNHLVEKAKEEAEGFNTQLKRLNENFAEEKEELMQKNQALVEEIKCLESVNAEQAAQIKDEIKKLFQMSMISPNSEFASNAQSICEKLNLKKEIAQLKAAVSQKEVILQKLAQKFTRTTTSLEENLKTAEREIKVLDNVIKKVYNTLEANSDLVEKHEALKNILSIVSGDCTISNIDSSDK